MRKEGVFLEDAGWARLTEIPWELEVTENLEMGYIYADCIAPVNRCQISGARHFLRLIAFRIMLHSVVEMVGRRVLAVA